MTSGPERVEAFLIVAYGFFLFPMRRRLPFLDAVKNCVYQFLKVIFSTVTNTESVFNAGFPNFWPCPLHIKSL